MNFKINQISDFGLQILNTARDGYIHSVYRKTINIYTNGELIALQSSRSFLSPVSLLSSLDENTFQELGIKPSMPVIINKTYISIAAYDFYYNSSKVIPCLLNKSLASVELDKLKQNLKAVISSSDTGGFDSIFSVSSDISPQLSPSLEAARTYLSKSYLAFKTGDYASSSFFLSQLIGLGSGLTPSGDDFLCGLLAGLILSGNSASVFTAKLKESINSSLKNTNDISCAFLRCALNNRFSLPINSLIKIPEPDFIYSCFRQIGHSSGMDTLCGILFALELS